MTDDDFPNMDDNAAADDLFSNALNFNTGEFRSIGSENVDSFDDQNFRQPLPPEDRVWRHPSEVAPAGETSTTPRASLVLVAMVASVLGASIAVGAVLWLRPVSETIVERRIEATGLSTS
ncbi:MAG: hypothetical protein ACC652_02855, partial [Acidimicrobiales bacterium]